MSSSKVSSKVSSKDSSFYGLSYFELATAIGFASMFSTGAKDCKFTTPVNVSDSPVFDFGDKTDIELEDELFQFLCWMKIRHFGIKDTMFFLQNFQKDMNASDIISVMRSMRFANSEMKNDICEVQIVSNLPTTQKVYLKNAPLPQEALDTFVFLKDAKSGKMYIVLGTKRMSPTITVHFTDGRTIEVLETGLYGNVIVGEHLEAHEKKTMNETYFRYLKNREETGRDFLKLDQKTASAPIRSLIEELGFVPTKEFTPFMIGKDTLPGRDARYWDDEFEGVRYGYKHNSSSLMVAFVGPFELVTLGEPLDTYECSKGQIVELEYALREFRVGGKLDCAFPSHSRMLRDAVNLLPELLAQTE
jgi:hypothetical protein